MKITLKEISHMKTGVISFVNTIYNNFIHLSNNHQLEHNRNELKRLLSSNNMLSYVAYHDTNIIAYIIGETKQLNDGRVVFYISYLYVGNKYRGMKLGSKLMSLIIQKCNLMGTTFVMLTCDTQDSKVYEFYKKMKFITDPILQNFTQHEILTLFL
jgi:ribosomal protein S18 acetylase RimI-like enzyme